MKKIILKLLGFDEASIEFLKQEINDLHITISTLKDESKDIYNRTEQAFMIIKMCGIDTKDEKWWEKETGYFSDHNTFMIVQNIRLNAKKEWIEKHPSLKTNKIFHGACLGCITPIKKGIGECLKCKWANWGCDYPNLFEGEK